MKKTKYTLDGSEQSMIPIIKNDAHKFPFGFKKNIISLEEFSAGTGISDLTIFTMDSDILKQRKNSHKPITSKNQIQVLLALLHGTDSSIDEIAANSKLSKALVQKILIQLVDEGVAIVSNHKYTASRKISRNTTDNIIAIEAKVRNWKSGVRQAMRYKEYADFSYLAIYESNINSCLDNINIFKQLGIGLIGVSDKGTVIHLEAQKSTVTTLENRFLAFERMISVVDNRHNSFIARNGFIANNTR